MFQFFLPLLTYPDPAPGPGLMHALDFAATLGGRVQAAAQVVDIPPITNPLATAMLDTSSMAAAAEAASRDRGDQLSQQATMLAKRQSIELGIEPLVSRPETTGDLLAERARIFDFTLMPFDSESGTHRGVAETLLFGSGGPVVFFPGTEAAAHLECAAVAWDHSMSASRAVRDALPILRLAKRVIVLTARDDKPVSDAGIEALLHYLSGHGIGATHIDQPVSGEPIGAGLQGRATTEDAGLLVMGAYGHSRFREFVLGGATRSALAGMRLPVLMSH